MNNTSHKEVLDKGPKYCEPKTRTVQKPEIGKHQQKRFLLNVLVINSQEELKYVILRRT
jgi:hypothetical protein